MYMKKCCNCMEEFNILICLPMYGYLCSSCYQDIVKDYLD